MKLTLSSNSTRFRLEQAELDQLLAGNPLVETLKFGSSAPLAIRLLPALQGNGLQLDHGPDHITLNACPDMLDQLAGLGRSKDGISTRQNGLEITLQVDVRSYPSRRESKCSHA